MDDRRRAARTFLASRTDGWRPPPTRTPRQRAIRAIGLAIVFWSLVVVVVALLLR